nr:MAG TPA: hypothetical protein [Caudoviricetes sp.]
MNKFNVFLRVCGGSFYPIHTCSVILYYYVPSRMG